MRLSHLSSLTIALILTGSASALELSRTLPAADISQPPSEVRFLIYSGPEVTLPLAIADFGPDEYLLEEQGDQVEISAEFLQDIEPEGLWIETELDGQVKGERVELRVPGLGITFAIGNHLDMDGNTITNLDMPVAPGDGLDVANRAYVDNADTTGNAATATALATDGENCDPGYYPLGVDSQGRVQGCTQESPDDNLGNHIATESLIMSNNRIVELAAPAAPTDAATRIYVDNADTTGNAATATALAADGADCPVGQYARGVSASGAAQGCAPAPAVGLSVGDMQYWNGSAWVLIPALGGAAKMLSVCDGIPRWTTSGCFSIGDRGPAGGIVFYVIDGGEHGLEAAPLDQSPAPWGCSGTDIPGAEGTELWTGAQNTAEILAGCPDSGIAARSAHGYELNGYSDWYLPSYAELYQLYTHRAVVGSFAGDYYWSSSEGSGTSAYGVGFLSGSVVLTPKNTVDNVRAIRTF